VAFASDTSGIKRLMRAGGDFDASSTVTDDDVTAFQGDAYDEVAGTVEAYGFPAASISSSSVLGRYLAQFENVTAILLIIDSGQFNVDKTTLIRFEKRRGALEKKIKALATNSGAAAASPANTARVGSMVRKRQTQESVTETFDSGPVEVS